LNDVLIFLLNHKNRVIMKKIFLSLILLAFATGVMAGTQYYRAVFRDDPSTTIDIEWSPSGTSTSPTVYYDIVGHGTTYASYAYNHGVDRSQSQYSITNEFSRLTGLTPNTIYYFVIHDASGTSAMMNFKTLPDNSSSEISFVSCGDSRTSLPTSSTNTDRANNFTLIGKIRPDFATFNGDFIYEGTSGETTTNWEAWLTDWQNTLGSIGHIVPLIPVMGNHEGSTDMYDFFDVPISNAYDALQIGGNLLRLYSLNSELSGEAVCDATEKSWLSNDLALYTGTASEPYWKFAHYHEPFVPHANYSAFTTLSACWAPLFLTYKMNLCCEAHAHCLAISYPIVQSTATGSDHGFIKDTVNGTVYMGEGGTGAPLYSVYTYYNSTHAYNWTRCDTSMFGMEYVCMNNQEIDIRIVEEVNVSSVGQVAITDPECTLPSGISIWKPSGGTPAIIYYHGTLTDVPNKYQENQMLHVAPMPAKDMVTISYPKLNDDARIEIYTSLGELMKTIPVASGSEFKEISIADLDAGTYIAHIISKTETLSCKIVHVH
jgi:hypothetical protein